MRIAFVIPGTGGGGVRSVVRIASGLAQRGHEILLLYRHSRPSLRERARSTYLGLRYGRRHDWLKSFLGRTQAYDTLTADVVGANDVLVGVGVDCVLAIADLPPWCGIKVHNSRGMEPWNRDQMLRVWHLSMPRIVVSAHLVREMRARDCTDSIFIAHNGVDRTEYFPSLPEDARQGVGTVYHGGSVKAPEIILEVFRKLAAARPATPLYAFGTYPRPRALPRKVRYVRLPPLAVARDLHSRSRVWFCASHSEGLPNPLLEAMACGCAVVSTDCGGPADFIESGVNGFLVPRGAADEIVARVARLLDDAALRQSFVEASDAVLAQFSWPHAVDSFDLALRSILAAAPDQRFQRQPSLSGR
jgi:glycosyltransferase involved in cell wall biosynthesis